MFHSSAESEHWGKIWIKVFFCVCVWGGGGGEVGGGGGGGQRCKLSAFMQLYYKCWLYNILKKSLNQTKEFEPVRATSYL